MALAHAVRDLVLAPRCAGCDAPGAWFCVSCRDLCDPVVQPAGRLVIRAAGVHGGSLRSAIHRLKYGGERGLAGELGGLVALELARDLAIGTLIDAVVPVPLHASRAFERGYDQADLLAQAVAARTTLPIRRALHRIRAGTSQVTLDRIARARNVHGSFVGEAGALRGLRIALVDDVATTGATVRDAATACRAAGARDVRAYVVATDA